MTIYIETVQHGQKSIVTSFCNRWDFVLYADEVMRMTDTRINNSDNIATVCEKLYDCGPGYGARHHCRITLREMKERGLSE